MNSNTLEHLKLIIAHIDKLLEQASKRALEEWELYETVNPEEPSGLLGVCSKTTGFDVAACHFPMNWNDGGRANAAFIASCAGNAEAGWRSAKAAITHIISGGRGYENGEELLTDSILAAWPLELLETKP